jgi:hypothetical protein
MDLCTIKDQGNLTFNLTNTFLQFLRKGLKVSVVLNTCRHLTALNTLLFVPVVQIGLCSVQWGVAKLVNLKLYFDEKNIRLCLNNTALHLCYQNVCIYIYRERERRENMGYHFLLATNSELAARIRKTTNWNFDKYVWLQGFDVEYSLFPTIFNETYI